MRCYLLLTLSKPRFHRLHMVFLRWNRKVSSHCDSAIAFCSEDYGEDSALQAAEHPGKSYRVQSSTKPPCLSCSLRYVCVLGISPRHREPPSGGNLDLWSVRLLSHKIVKHRHWAAMHFNPPRHSV